MLTQHAFFIEDEILMG